LSSSSGGAAGTFVAIGVTYWVAYVAAVALAAAVLIAVGLVFLAVVLTLIFVQSPDKPSMRGWAVFVCGAGTAISVPYLAFRLVALGGEGSVDAGQLGLSGNLLILFCGAWFFVDLFLVTPAMYRYARQIR